MASTGAPVLAPHSCVSCKHGKRKCDRLTPRCSACTRIHRTCVYEAGPEAGPSIANATNANIPQVGALFQPEAVASIIDPFSGLAGEINLQRPNVDVIVRNEALRTLGSLQGVHTTAGIYFNSTHLRMTVVSKTRFLARLAGFSESAPADLAALCLAMHLVVQPPQSPANRMQSSLYARLKSVLSFLEASNYHSLEVVQCRLLCAFYELGHGIHPAVSITIGACSRIGRFIGLDTRAFQTPERQSNNIVEEEWRRVWWMLANLDRFVSLCSGDHLFCTQDARVGEVLPIDDQVWLQDIIPTPTPSDATLSTTHDIRVGQLARECQVSHLAGRVVRHVFDPASDSSFQEHERSQLERTLLALMPILSAEELQFGRYCSSLGICSSALYLLYDYAGRRTGDVVNDQRNLSAMEPLSTQIADFSNRLFGESGEDADYSTFSPYVPLSLYQSAVVQLRLWKQTGNPAYHKGLNSLKAILGYFNRRWAVSGFYLDALEQDLPVLLPHANPAR